MPIFQPELETLPRPELERLQRERLRDRFGVELEALPELPFRVKSELREAYPFGLLQVPLEKCVRIHASSGTRGKATIVAFPRVPEEAWIRTHSSSGTCRSPKGYASLSSDLTRKGSSGSASSSTPNLSRKRSLWSRSSSGRGSVSSSGWKIGMAPTILSFASANRINPKEAACAHRSLPSKRPQ